MRTVRSVVEETRRDQFLVVFGRTTHQRGRVASLTTISPSFASIARLVLGYHHLGPVTKVSKRYEPP